MKLYYSTIVKPYNFGKFYAAATVLFGKFHTAVTVLLEYRYLNSCCVKPFLFTGTGGVYGRLVTVLGK